MTFASILFEQYGAQIDTIEVPEFFKDLNLDQIIDTILLGKQEYHLEPFFRMPLHDIGAIQYRHEVMGELDDQLLLTQINAFAQKMHKIRDYLAQADKLHYPLQKQSWFLDAVEIYCDAVNELGGNLSLLDLKSNGFLAFREFLTSYIGSPRFSTLMNETKQLKADLASVRYAIVIKGNTIKVRNYEPGSDYSADVETTFAKFKQDAVKDYKVKISDWIEMNHVEAKVLEFVALLNPDLFTRLEAFCGNNPHYLDETIKSFDREIQFYIAYLEYMKAIKSLGLSFCYPQISTQDKAIFDEDGFDLALAYKLLREKSPIVTNDFFLQGGERVLVVSGPNQGGKTTFARTFGQLHYLASLGCPVPGQKARLYLFDQIFTHFENQEDINNLSGKLQDDLVRIHDILNRATPDSIIILNEIFTSTTLEDAVFLSKRVLERIFELDLICVCVTFIDELSSFNEKTVSMVSTVSPDDPTLRTFKILRKPADGLSYAISIAEKYRLTYRYLEERLNA